MVIDIPVSWGFGFIKKEPLFLAYAPGNLKIHQMSNFAGEKMHKPNSERANFSPQPCSRRPNSPFLEQN